MRLAEHRTDDTGVILVTAFPVDTSRLSDGMLINFALRRPMIMPAASAQRV